MNLNVLRYVEAVAKECSFTKAAEALYVAQPSLSQAIRALERELGTELFDRSGRKMRLTPSGEKYLSWATTVLRTESRLKKELSASPGGLRKLTVGASPYRCKALFPEAIAAFYRKVPDCTIELFDQYQQNAMALLDEDKLDLVIDLPPAGGYGLLPVASERVLFAVHERFSLPHADGGDFPTVRLSDLLSLPVIWIDDAEYKSPVHLGPILRRLYAEAGVPPNIVLQCRGAEMAHLLAAKALGFTAISELFMRGNALPGLRYCEISGHSVTRQVSAIWNPARPLSEDGRTFIELLRQQGAPSSHPLSP